jgi:hypothetical protein
MREKLPFVFVVLLIFLFFFNVTTTASEYPMRDEQVLTVLLEGGIFMGLIGTKSKLPPWLFWTALVCGIGVFALRLTSDQAWWTGHLMYSRG